MEAGRHSAVARAEAGAERVGRDIEAPIFEAESNGRSRKAHERLLLALGHFAGVDRVVGPHAAVGDGMDQPGQSRAERRENLLDLRRGGARLVALDQRIVGFAAFRPAVVLGALARQINHFLQMRGKEGKIGGLARLLPRLLRQRSRAAQFFHMGAGQFAFAVVVMLPLADVGELDGALGDLLAGALIDEFADFPACGPLVDHA